MVQRLRGFQNIRYNESGVIVGVPIVLIHDSLECRPIFY